MIKPYLLLALRHLLRHRIDTAVKIISLMLSVTGCLLIAFFVQHEWRYDTFHENADRLYRVNHHSKTPDGSEDKSAITPRPLGGFMQSNLSEIDQTLRLKNKNAVVRKENQLFNASILFADPNFFSVLSFPLQNGNPTTALSNSYQIVLTPEEANKYFGTQDVVGKTLDIRIEDTFYEFQVAALTQPVPSYTTIPFTILAPMQWLEQKDAGNLHTGEVLTFATLKPGTDAKSVEDKLLPLLQKVDQQMFAKKQYFFQPIQDIHLDSSYFGEIVPPGESIYLYLAVLAGAFLLLVGCINFVTLTAGRSVNRAREVGVRKALGATRSQLIRQFLSESFLLTSLTVVGSLCLAYLLLPHFNRLLHKSITLRMWDPYIVATLLGIMLCTGLLAGLFPAWFLSHFSPVKVLRGQTIINNKNNLIRLLVMIQFIIASTLLVGTVVMNRQLHLLQNKPLGFNESQVIRIEVPYYESIAIAEDFYSQIASLSQVENMTASWQLFGHEAAGVGYQRFPVEGEGKEVNSFSLGVGPGFQETMQLEIINGRSLSSSWQEEMPPQVLVNESFVNAMGWEDPLGRRISQMFAYSDAEIVGVVKDFHFLSLHQTIAPLVIHPASYYTNLYIRISGRDQLSSINELEKYWHHAIGDIPFIFHFLDGDIMQQYLTEQRWTHLITYTSAIIVLIACLGLFGMVSMVTSQRTKEVGIRKVLGASLYNVLLLFSRDYIKLILIAYLVSVPLANYFITDWLDTFAYRIEIHWWMYAVPGLVVLLIALLSLMGQTFKAARQNPVDSLRYE